MNPPLIFASASLVRQRSPRPSRRSRRRPLAGILATAICGLTLALPLLAGIAAGGMAAILTREHLIRESAPTAPQSPEPAADPSLSALPPAMPAPSDPTATDEASLTRALRLFYQTNHPHTAESDLIAHPPPSA